jgi:hypothetical protein
MTAAEMIAAARLRRMYMAKETVHSPVDYGQHSSTKPSGRAKLNGEPGLPERTVSKDSVPEVTYDECGGLKPGEQK